MGQQPPSIQKALAADAKLRLHFPGVTHLKAGDNLTIPQATPAPTLSIATSALKSEPGIKYLAISVDLDAPFPSWSFLSPILHGLHFDLVPGTPDADGFVPLEGGSEWLVPWLPPGPPKPSSAHRYVFLVFEQPKELDAAKIRTSLKLAQEVKLTARLWWNEEDAEKKLGLGEVLAGNYFNTHA
ncbi:PEBP-like protein [Xylaria bambusicola]|uniref:PEBP-like protein n=1 Tax=Xylaria bambusicola TaxID=326684 RepID=UPI0020083072|nr:PEBP-like protein [Xylaria bambusicola]KAI0525545.1 PEBP-like protein [Xylaria bambusicola]